jgi:hypothetical protein
MKWDNLKKSIARDAYTLILRMAVPEAQSAAIFNAIEENIKPRISLQKLAGFTYEAIVNWDIRRVEKLRECFPDSFPKSLREGKIMAYWDEKGNWCVEKMESLS